jgi:hypothetical protein
MRSLRLFLFLGLCLVSVSNAYAYQTNEDISPDEASRFLSLLKIKFGEDAQASPLSFDDMENGTAMTGIKKNSVDQKPTLFTAQIQPTKDGAELMFLVFSECVLTDTSKLNERIIKIAGQKINAFYACGYPPGKLGDYRQVYVIKSAQGKEFARRKFEEKKWVFVEFEGFPVPFETAGFAKFWAASSGSAL